MGRRRWNVRNSLTAKFVQRFKSDGTQSYENIARFDEGQGTFIALPIDLDSETDMVFLGLLGTGFRDRSSLEAVTARIGGMPVEVLYAGPQAAPGIDQINLSISRDLAGRGEMDVEIMVENRALNVVKIAVR